MKKAYCPDCGAELRVLKFGDREFPTCKYSCDKCEFTQKSGTEDVGELYSLFVRQYGETTPETYKLIKGEIVETGCYRNYTKYKENIGESIAYAKDADVTDILNNIESDVCDLCDMLDTVRDLEGISIKELKGLILKACDKADNLKSKLKQ